jgi:hypothetical protein
MAEHFSGEILMRTICAFLSALPFLTVAAALAVDNRGLVKAPVLMQIPKQERDVNFAVTLLVVHKDATLIARDVSVRRSRAER